jgi:two-component system NarL family sensor kinase
LEAELAPLRAAGIAVEATIDDIADEEVRTVATRVLTEAVRNVHRHAFATQVQVTLLVRGDTVVGRIIDNGIGARDDDLTRALADGHVGLLMSRAMVESIGGTFSVHGTGRSEGTTVEFEAPLWPSRRGRKE